MKLEGKYYIAIIRVENDGEYPYFSTVAHSAANTKLMAEWELKNMPANCRDIRRIARIDEIEIATTGTIR